MATEATRQPRRGPRYRSLHSRDWERIEAAVPRRREVSVAARKAHGLSDPNRLALALLIHEAGRACVTDLADLTGIERSVVSRHLLRLRRAGLSETRRRGKLSLHSLTPEGERLLAALTAE
jgi:ArsR family transcriptional regulator